MSFHEKALLQWHRTALCDLLLGRIAREKAGVFLQAALSLAQEGHSAFITDDLLEHAAHIEWCAVRLEWGKIRLGERNNRCGYQPQYAEEDDAG